MRPEEHTSRSLAFSGWSIRITCYRLGDVHYAAVESLDAGAKVARAEAATREEAERLAFEKAARRLAATRRMG